MLGNGPRHASGLRTSDTGQEPLETYHPETTPSFSAEQVWLARRSLALRPAHSRRHLYVTRYTEGFSHFVTSMTAPVASGWSVRRVGLAPTGKRRLLTAHANSGHSTKRVELVRSTPRRLPSYCLVSGRREAIPAAADFIRCATRLPRRVLDTLRRTRRNGSDKLALNHLRATHSPQSDRGPELISQVPRLGPVVSRRRFPMSITAPRSGGQILIDQLVVQGVDHVHCIPGKSYLAALDALHNSAIEVVVCRQEAGAAIAALTVGRLTGRPGICFVTRGPGATNAAHGVHIAEHDSAPRFSSSGRSSAPCWAWRLQEMDYRAFFGATANR